MKRPGESDLDYFYRLKAENLAERQQRLERARQAADREVYDYERLVKLLRPLIPSIPSQEELEESYYLGPDRIKTLEAFAKFLGEAELYDGGDMHLDQGWQRGEV